MAPTVMVYNNGIFFFLCVRTSGVPAHLIVKRVRVLWQQRGVRTWRRRGTERRETPVGQRRGGRHGSGRRRMSRGRGQMVSTAEGQPVILLGQRSFNHTLVSQGLRWQGLPFLVIWWQTPTSMLLRVHPGAIHLQIKVFVGINILMGIHRLHSYLDYWSSDPALRVSYVADTLPRNRYEQLSRYLHCSNPGIADSGDKLHKVRLLIWVLQENFPKLFRPWKNLSIDEAMIQFDCRLLRKQYLPKKPVRSGVSVTP